MSRKRPSFMVHDLLKETEVTLKHWQREEIFNFPIKKKVLLDDNNDDGDDDGDDDDGDDDGDDGDDNISHHMEEIDNFSKLYSNKINFINQQYKSHHSSLFNVYTSNWDNCLFSVKHTIPLDKEDLLNNENEKANHSNSMYLTTTSSSSSSTSSSSSSSASSALTTKFNKTNENEILFYHDNINKKLMKKSRKARTAFTDYQLTELEQSFDRQKYLAVQDRMELATKLSLSDRQVKTWYQNRRTKWKRQTAVGLELMTEAENFVAIQRLIEQSPFWAYHPTVRYILSNIDLIHKSSSSSSLSSTVTTTTSTMATLTTTKPITVGISLNNHEKNLPFFQDPPPPPPPLVTTKTETNELTTTSLDIDNHHHHHHYRQHLQSSRIINTLPITTNSLHNDNNINIKSSLLCIPSSDNNISLHTKSINSEQLEMRKKLINLSKNQSISNQTFDLQQLWSIKSSLNQSINNECLHLPTSLSLSSSVTSICNSLIEGT
ncbi:unnamed protein product [Schistosoma margrebowiei]|uniref:Homeobox domain-containing protein n=1 Tax=Schistosoma margrebowiei TaxID=48269 RepID=A0AA85AGC7_9TREM|nr:unnamed protein product [Schistosoma margrebowiei]